MPVCCSSTVQRAIFGPLEDLSGVPADTLLLTVVGEDDRVARDIDAKKIFYGTKLVPLKNKNYVILCSDDHGNPPLKATHFAPVAPDKRYDSGEKKEGGKESGFLSRLRQQRSGENGEMSDVRQGGEGIDALDTHGIWKLYDALLDAAFFGKNRNIALGNTPEQRFMGRWSDGRPVKELEVNDEP